MSKNAQNLVVVIDPSTSAYNISSKAANMYLNRFCIDEDAGFESSGVFYFQESVFDYNTDYKDTESEIDIELSKGKLI